MDKKKWRLVTGGERISSLPVRPIQVQTDGCARECLPPVGILEEISCHMSAIFLRLRLSVSSNRLSTTRIIALAFAAIILTGALFANPARGLPQWGILRFSHGPLYCHLCHLRDGPHSCGYLCPVERLWAGGHFVSDSDWGLGFYVHCLHFLPFRSTKAGPEATDASGSGYEPQRYGGVWSGYRSMFWWVPSPWRVWGALVLFSVFYPPMALGMP